MEADWKGINDYDLELMKYLRKLLISEEIRHPRDVDRLMNPDKIKKMISESV